MYFCQIQSLVSSCADLCQAALSVFLVSTLEKRPMIQSEIADEIFSVRKLWL